jgi:hypothetical protein
LANVTWVSASSNPITHMIVPFGGLHIYIAFTSSDPSFDSSFPTPVSALDYVGSCGSISTLSADATKF